MSKLIKSYYGKSRARSSISGFTLIELLVVISIISILSTIGAAVFSGIRQTANDSKRRADIHAIASAYENTYNPASGLYSNISGDSFRSGSIPTPPEGGNYNVIFTGTAPNYTGYRVCAVLGATTPSTCNDPTTPNCSCEDSKQGRYIAAYSQASYGGSYSQASYGSSSNIAFISAGSTPVGAAAPSIVVNLPSGVQNQDLMIAQLAVFGNLNSSEINVPNNWNLIAETGAGGMTQLLYWKRANSETGPYTWSFTDTNTGAAVNKTVGAGIVVYRNAADPAIPFETSFGISPTASTAITAQPLTTSTANQLIIYFGMIGAATTITAPAGYSERYGNGLIEAADTNQPVAGSGTVIGPVSGNAGAAGLNIGQILALRPSSAPASPAPAWPAISLGAAINPQYNNEPLYISSLLTKGFDSISPGNGLFMQGIEPTAQDQFDFKTADLVVNFARTYHKKFHGTPFLWDNLLPSWFTNNFTTNSTLYTQAQLTGIMNNYINTMGNRYKNIANIWTVVNEAVSHDGSSGLRSCGKPNSTDVNTPSPWACINPITSGYAQCTSANPCNYIDQAFLKSRAVLGPSVKLCYNDYNAEDLNTKSNYIYSMVQSMKNRNIPIDCVGLQSHVSSGQTFNLASNIQRFNALGLEVRITEIDVKVGTTTPNATQLAQQATTFSNFATACKNASNCPEYTTWGVGDLHTWLAPEAPLLLDTSYNNKPAYTSVKSVLGF